MKSIFLAAVVVLFGSAAIAAPQCGPRDQVAAMLSNDYKETRRAIGIAGQAAVMELFASDATGTWSITMTLPDGLMCLMASGGGYEVVQEELPPQGDLN